ncbi:unnamed protein product [Tetraodon nigroviridis]|uniref:(spotted green pufferfish) hypothetical protein n=1 Tax=Tetraodon nigroviridis TaxID=99883 RepID=Q4SNK2_TETNG|nr:unnamed protein product [Tetraodon nigroviridis]
MIVEVSRSVCLMTSQILWKLLRSKEASAAVDARTWPPVLDTDDLPKKKPPLLFKPSDSDTLAYLDFSVSTTGMLAGMSHGATSAFCRSIKLQCELYPSREVALCLEPCCGLGFVLWCLCSVYSGQPVHPHPSVRAGGQPVSLAVGCQSVQSARHLLLLQRHGAVHQRSGPADGGSEGRTQRSSTPDRRLDAEPFCSSGSRAGLVPGQDLCGGSRGASQDSLDRTVLLQTLQGPGAPPPSRQHLLRLPGQPGHLSAGGSSLPVRFLLGSAGSGPVLSGSCGLVNQEPDLLDEWGW